MAEESSNPLTYTHKPLPVAEEIDTYPQGLGGWMVLICFFVIGSFVLSLRDIVDPQPGFGFNNLRLLMHSEDPALTQLFYLVLIYQIMAVIYIIFAGFLIVLLFTKNKKFPALYTFFLITETIWSLGVYFWGVSMVETSLWKDIDIYSMLGIVLLVLIMMLPIACIVVYLRRSRRVKATFINSW